MLNFTSVFSKLNIILPTPKYLTFDTVAVDISPEKVRVMKLKRKIVGLIPEFYKEVSLPKKYDINDISDPKQIHSEAIKGLIDTLKTLKTELSLNHVTVSLPERKTYIFRTILPKQSASDVASAIRYSIEENVPLKVEDINFDYHIISVGEKGVDVVVRVFPKSIIKSYTQIFKEAGLFVVSFQSESVALSSAVIVEGYEEPCLLIRFLEDSANIAIVENNVVQYTSTINIDTKQMIKDYDSSRDASEIQQELNKLLVYWFTSKGFEYPHKKIQIAYIMGEFAMVPGIQEFLERHLRINIEVANVWANCFATTEYIPEISQEEAIRYAVAIGLAIKGVTHK